VRPLLNHHRIGQAGVVPSDTESGVGSLAQLHRDCGAEYGVLGLLHLTPQQTLKLVCVLAKVMQQAYRPEETIHPWRDSQHDDLVFATALGYWRATLVTVSPAFQPGG
jgi:hypothetical protein